MICNFLSKLMSPFLWCAIFLKKLISIVLLRQIIHPRIPQLAIIGYDEGLSSILSNEMRCQWLAHLLNENIQLPTIREMEKDIKLWEDNMKQNTKNFNSRSCIVTCGIWYNDQLCKDMKCNHLRKKNIFAELFEPYGPTDYNGLLHKCLWASGSSINSENGLNMYLNWR
jgi:dimethylaniline monooxygenase (N-oxide forming)